MRGELDARKRQIVEAVVEKVLIGGDREIQVVFKLDVLSMLEGDAESSTIQLAGTCSRKRSPPPHRIL